MCTQRVNGSRMRPGLRAGYPFESPRPSRGRADTTGLASVLVVTSDWRFREALLGMLEHSPLLRAGGVAEGIEEALSMVDTLHPAAILVAGRSPLAELFDVSWALRRFRPGIPMVLLAEHATESEVFEAMKNGIEAVVKEEATTSPEVICEAVRVVVSGGFLGHGDIVHDLLLRLARQGSASAADRSRLTPRQLQVLALLTRGKPNREIGQALGISEQCVKNHVGRILRKLDVPNRTAAATLALEQDLLALHATARS